MAQGEYPGVMRQELDQVTQGITAGTNRMTFTLPPVPQSLAWTGSVSITPALGSIHQSGIVNPTIVNSDFELFAGASYFLYRNGQPWLWWRGLNTVYNIRATSQDVIQIEVQFPNSLPFSDAFQARWVGQSVPLEESPFVWPYIAGPANGPIEVFTNPLGPGQGNGNPFTVLEYPVPSTVRTSETNNRLTSPVAAGSVVLLPAGSGGINGFYLWGLYLHAATASLSTVTGAQSWHVHVGQTVAGNDLATINLDNVPGTTQDENTGMLDMRGLEIPAGDGLTVSWTASGVSLAAYAATAVWVQNNGNPG